MFDMPTCGAGESLALPAGCGAETVLDLRAKLERLGVVRIFLEQPLKAIERVRCAAQLPFHL